MSDTLIDRAMGNSPDGEGDVEDAEQGQDNDDGVSHAFHVEALTEDQENVLHVGSRIVGISEECLDLWDDEDYLEGVLVVGGRSEIRLSDPKWQSPKGREMVEKGVVKEWRNVHGEKQALIPVSREDSNEVR